MIRSEAASCIHDVTGINKPLTVRECLAKTVGSEQIYFFPESTMYILTFLPNLKIKVYVFYFIL
jgi:hypothetical protein